MRSYEATDARAVQLDQPAECPARKRGVVVTASCRICSDHLFKLKAFLLSARRSWRHHFAIDTSFVGALPRLLEIHQVSELYNLMQSWYSRPNHRFRATFTPLYSHELTISNTIFPLSHRCLAFRTHAKSSAISILRLEDRRPSGAVPRWDRPARWSSAALSARS